MILSQYNLAVTCFMDKTRFIQGGGSSDVCEKNIEYKCPEVAGIIYRKSRVMKKWETKFTDIGDFKIKIYKDPTLIERKIKEEILKRGFM